MKESGKPAPDGADDIGPNAEILGKGKSKRSKIDPRLARAFQPGKGLEHNGKPLGQKKGAFALTSGLANVL